MPTSGWKRLLAGAPWFGGAGRRAAARALREPVAAGPVADAGRQGPGALDALRRQRAGAGAAVLEELFHRPPTRGVGRGGPWFHPPAPGGRLRAVSGRAGRPAPGRLPHSAVGRRTPVGP